MIASGGAGAGVAAIASATLLGLRNGLYAIRMAPIVGGPLWRRLLAAPWTIDESTAVGTAQPTLRSQRVGFWLTGGLIYVGWNLTTLVGALLGDLVGDVRTLGLDAAAAAAFLGLLWPRLVARQPVVVAGAAAVVAALLIPVLPPGLPVLAAAAVAGVVGALDLFRGRGAGPVPPAGQTEAGTP